MKRIADSDLVVSEVCLGTMTFGEQIDEDTSHLLLNKATKELGINFIDTAESYPVPSCPATAGKTEKIIGSWLKTERRENVFSKKTRTLETEKVAILKMLKKTWRM